MTPAELKEARQSLGLTQTQLAEKLGVTLRAVQHYEGGSRQIPEPTARLIALLK